MCDHIDDPGLRTASGGRDYDEMYADFLHRADPSLRTRAYDVVGGELPADPDECDGWIITGARHDAYRDEPWIVELRAFIARLYEARSRTVGVCFGHQVVAHALGGSAANAGEWRAGPQELNVESTQWFAGGNVWLHAMHQDVAAELPPDATTIGIGSTAAHPIYLVGESILCVQDHPEYEPAYISALIEARRGRLGDELTEDALVRVGSIDTDNSTVGHWIVDFLLDHRS
ncbi:MAG: type 1 glutamine amidotransferase [Ilumatobacteraceae bacterium]